MNILFMLSVNPFDFGFTVALVGFGIVLLALTLLSIVFSKLPNMINIKFKRKPEKHEEASSTGKIGQPVVGNVTAAVSLALHLYFDELHDEESNIVTIKQVRKAYSPWSSKIYSVTRNWPHN